MAKPTREDADMMLRLSEGHALQNVNEAAAFVWSDEFTTDYEKFKAKSGNREESLVHRLLGWYETVGTLYRNGLINEDLLFDWLAVPLVWERVKTFALAVRRETGEPRMFENLEYMAEHAARWKPSRD